MRCLLTLLPVFLLTACGSTQYYMIPPSEVAPISATAHTTNDSTKNNNIYALRYLTLPDYLDNQYVIYYDGEGKVNRNPKRLWNANLSDNIRNNLQQHLSANGLSSLYTYPLPTNIRANQIIDIQIREMIANAKTKQFYINADWQLTTSDNYKQSLYHFKQNYPLDNTQTNTLIKLYQRALIDLSNAIFPTLFHH